MSVKHQLAMNQNQNANGTRLNAATVPQCLDCKWSLEKHDRLDRVICCCSDSPHNCDDVEATHHCDHFEAICSGPACPAWLREQGATQPMSATGVTHLVLGKFQRTEGKETGTYPVSYYKPMFCGRRGGEETWYHYHEKLEEAPTRQQCLDWVSEQNK